MERKDELKEIDIQNYACYHFDNIITLWDRDVNFSDILLDEKLYEGNDENILIYNISYKTSKVAKPLRVRFDKIDGFIKVYHKTRYLVLFD